MRQATLQPPSKPVHPRGQRNADADQYRDASGDHKPRRCAGGVEFSFGAGPADTPHSRNPPQRAAMDWHTQLAVVATTAYAMALGGAIGFEREMKKRPAGFRTHMLVSGAAALLLGIGLLVLADPSVPHLKRVQIDPLRLMEAVVAGVAFIGAGTIFSARGPGAIAGITTAASLLMAAVIGAAAGLHYYLVALAATLLTLLVLAVLNLFERCLLGRTPAEKDQAANERGGRSRPG